MELGQYTLHVLDQIQPRNIDANGSLEPFAIFTDAAFESSEATWGIVALDPVSNTRHVCGGKVPCNLVEGWQRLGGQQIITQAEAFAVLLARRAYAKLLYGRRSLFFVDNEGARYAFIKGLSPSLPLLKVVQLFFLAGEHDKSLTWLERVPSHSNIDDLPSRGESRKAAEIVGAEVVALQCDIEVIANECLNFTDIPSCLSLAASPETESEVALGSTMSYE